MEAGRLLLQYCDVPLMVKEMLRMASPQVPITTFLEVGESKFIVTWKAESSRGSMTICDSFCPGLVGLFEKAVCLSSTFMKRD